MVARDGYTEDSQAETGKGDGFGYGGGYGNGWGDGHGYGWEGGYSYANNNRWGDLEICDGYGCRGRGDGW